MDRYDILVIGAGLGGLTAGAKLAKEGKRVLMIEQHSIPGGCATTFQRKQYTMEVGLHEIDGLDEDDPKNETFEYLRMWTGSVYGFAQLPKQAGIFRLPNKSTVKNLYFASAWTNPGGGFTGAILSGWFCAKKVLKAPL